MRPDRETGRNAERVAIAEAHLGLVPEGTPATPGERGFESCSCPKDCALHDSCLLCTAYHARKGKPPRCER